jgi:hypothetical protein
MSGQADGSKLFEMYTKTLERGGGGLKLNLAANAVESGIYAVWERLQSGRLKIFKSCTQVQREFGLYHRKDGKVVKSNDHLLDALRYLCMAESYIWKFPESEVVNGRRNVIDMAQHMNACI